MIMKKQNLLNDKSYQKYVKKKNITQKTLDSYMYAILNFCNANNKTSFNQMIEEIQEEQYPYIDKQGRIHEYNPNYGLIDNYIYNTVEYLRSKGNSNNSIQSIITRIRVVLTGLNIKLPDKIELLNDKKEWYVLSKEDIKYVNSISPLHHQAFITFMAHTGMRKADIANFKISDFMKATYKYHECNEIDDFLDKAPEDMIGYWRFKPQKTRKYGLMCKVYNTAESSNLLLESLHRRRKIIETRNHKKGTNFKLEKNDALFSSREKNYKGPLNTNTITVLCSRRNEQLREYHKRQLQQQLNDGEISDETYNNKLKQIPKFHPHGLRKFFITTLAKKRVDLRASAFLEGHKPFMQHDRSYVDEDELEDLLFEEYTRVIPALSFLKDEEDFELGKKNHDLRIENTQLRENMKNLQEENQTIMEDFRQEAKKVLDDLLRDNNIIL